ncbi:hypothetical protein N7462_008048 [Penicillium macrosclerotiorum]|uniref:uncharacterized protein n=1 Tax=Penicillium macrosclerotiorum TaxID=303699 RepID=UPI0025497B55|nr:uncharacterized protein N7462_008048 [Penicillium macrosclerotiorum]KAJ5679804.1 hypothetical protein N7462_008048 [Penicillium macrosclerotiorum]
MSDRSSRPNKQQRQDLAEETHFLTSNILEITNASTEAVLFTQLLPFLEERKEAGKAPVYVRNQDSFTAAEMIHASNPAAKIGVLNMASEKNPGGGWLRGALAQEEALCLRSTLAATLHERFYPLPVYGAIWSSDVAVFRGEVDSWCRVYQPDEIFTVGVISLAALRRPVLTADKTKFARPQDIDKLKNKMRQVFRVLALQGVTHCILGAMGCGAFQNPPAEVARIYKEVLDEAEWNGVFEEIVFAVLDTRNEGNYALFRDTLSS